MGGSSFNPLSVILKKHKLTGPNNIDCKHNLNLVLIVEGYKFVLTEKCSEQPGNEATNEEAHPYQKWKKANEMARCYILAPYQVYCNINIKIYPLPMTW